MSKLRAYKNKTTAILLVALMVLVLGALLVGSKFRNQPNNPAIAINKGLDYLKHNSESVSGVQWLALDYLQRKFKLNPWFNAVNRNISPPYAEPLKTDFQLHKRIAYPDSKVDSLPYKDALPVRQMMMAATHCDYIPLPADFEQLVRSNLASGGYSLSHVGYILERMKENGCQLPADVDRQIREEAAKGTVVLIENMDTTPDLRYESIAFLMHMGRRDLIQQEWIDAVVSEQRRDGGWEERRGDNRSNDHATVMALWALLEYTYPNAPDEPVLRRPHAR